MVDSASWKIVAQQSARTSTHRVAKTLSSLQPRPAEPHTDQFCPCPNVPRMLLWHSIQLPNLRGEAPPGLPLPLLKLAQALWLATLRLPHVTWASPQQLLRPQMENAKHAYGEVPTAATLPSPHGCQWAVRSQPGTVNPGAVGKGLCHCSGWSLAKHYRCCTASMPGPSCYTCR